MLGRSENQAEAEGSLTTTVRADFAKLASVLDRVRAPILVRRHIGEHAFRRLVRPPVLRFRGQHAMRTATDVLP